MTFLGYHDFMFDIILVIMFLKNSLKAIEFSGTAHLREKDNLEAECPLNKGKSTRTMQ